MNSILNPEPHIILSIVNETEAEYTIRVKCRAHVQHGQFFMLSIPKFGEAPISVGARSKDWIEFTIQKVGRVTDGLFALRPGNVIYMRGPYGNAFPIDTFIGKHMVVIAGGTGMSPVRSILQHFADHPDQIPMVTFLAGFKNRDSVLFEEDLARFRNADNFRTIYCLDNMDAEGFQKGFVTQYIPQVPFDSFSDYNVIIVGPPAMIDASAKECMQCGVPAEKIWVSLARRMSCAVGKCGHCRINETYVCQEGPVFNYSKAKDLFD